MAHAFSPVVSPESPCDIFLFCLKACSSTTSLKTALRLCTTETKFCFTAPLLTTCWLVYDSVLHTSSLSHGLYPLAVSHKPHSLQNLLHSPHTPSSSLFSQCAPCLHYKARCSIRIRQLRSSFSRFFPNVFLIVLLLALSTFLASSALITFVLPLDASLHSSTTQPLTLTAKAKTPLLLPPAPTLLRSAYLKRTPFLVSSLPCPPVLNSPYISITNPTSAPCVIFLISPAQPSCDLCSLKGFGSNRFPQHCASKECRSRIKKQSVITLCFHCQCLFQARHGQEHHYCTRDPR